MESERSLRCVRPLEKGRKGNFGEEGGQQSGGGAREQKNQAFRWQDEKKPAELLQGRTGKCSEGERTFQPKLRKEAKGKLLRAKPLSFL